MIRDHPFTVSWYLVASTVAMIVRLLTAAHGGG